MSLLQFCINNSQHRRNDSAEKTLKYLGEDIPEDLKEVKYVGAEKDPEKDI